MLSRSELIDLSTAILALHLVLFFISLVFILRSKIATKSQKYYQSFLSALLPLVGPSIVICVHVSDKLKMQVPSDKYYANQPPDFDVGQV